ncbi:hypothetical protein [Mesorhizobium sp. M0029]|uniref:hypothetical protein n=1 Tax=Mesorhizobium sp. M0029 TaxID=2956850 RepID=UPI00333D605F
MRLDFNVLWVEDQQGSVQSQRERIELLVRREGFRLGVAFAASVDEAKAFLSDDIYGDHIDLVVMDYDLGAGKKGDDGLVEVRQLFSYKDIVFYSSQASDLLEMVQKRRVQGVFCSTRDDLPNTVEGVFGALVKKVLDIDHSRGIVMGATSDIDHLINDCLVTLFASSDEAKQGETISALQKRTKQKRIDFEKSAAFVEAIKHLEGLADQYHIYTSADRLRLLTNLAKLNGVSEEKIETMKAYLNRVIPDRNKLAHVRVQTKGFSRKLVDNKGVELTGEAMKALRQALLEHQEHFELLAVNLGCASKEPA